MPTGSSLCGGQAAVAEGRLVVSVLIVSYNTREVLRACLEALAASQHAPPFEVLVYDNASADGSAEMVEGSFPAARLVRGEANIGFGAACNRLGALAPGKWLLLLNSDAFLGPDALAALLADAGSGSRLIAPRLLETDGSIQASVRRVPDSLLLLAEAVGLGRIARRSPLDGAPIPHDSYASGAALLVERGLWSELGGFDERFFFYGEDTDWCKRFAKAGWRRVFLSSALAIHYGGAGSAAYPVKYYLALEKADLQYWRKHHDGIACHAYILVKSVYHAMYGVIWLALLALRSARKDKSLLKTQGHLACLLWLLLGREYSWAS
jgi:GT2 family glycosyltransferase